MYSPLHLAHYYRFAGPDHDGGALNCLFPGSDHARLVPHSPEQQRPTMLEKDPLSDSQGEPEVFWRVNVRDAKLFRSSVSTGASLCGLAAYAYLENTDFKVANIVDIALTSQ